MTSRGFNYTSLFLSSSRTHLSVQAPVLDSQMDFPFTCSNTTLVERRRSRHVRNVVAKFQSRARLCFREYTCKQGQWQRVHLSRLEKEEIRVRNS